MVMPPGGDAELPHRQIGNDATGGVREDDDLIDGRRKRVEQRLEFALERQRVAGGVVERAGPGPGDEIKSG